MAEILRLRKKIDELVANKVQRFFSCKVFIEIPNFIIIAIHIIKYNEFNNQ